VHARAGRGSPTPASSHCVRLKSLTPVFFGGGEVLLFRSHSAIPRGQPPNRRGTRVPSAMRDESSYWVQRGSTLKRHDCPLPPKAGEHPLLPHPTSPLTRSPVPLPMHPCALHTATGTRRVTTGETREDASQEVPSVALSPGTGFGTARCRAVGIPGSRAEHLGPTDMGQPRGSGGSPEGIRGAKLSDALARRLRRTRLGRPGPPVQSPLLK